MSEVYHVTPQNDLREHWVDGYSCWCRPHWHETDGGDVIVHNSMDGREKYETGERKPS